MSALQLWLGGFAGLFIGTGYGWWLHKESTKGGHRAGRGRQDQALRAMDREVSKLQERVRAYADAYSELIFGIEAACHDDDGNPYTRVRVARIQEVIAESLESE